MGQIEDLRLFASVVDHKSISRAAATQNIAKSAVSRRLALLEQRFNTRLIDREPGVWQVTETGRELYQRAQQVIEGFEEIEHDFSDHTQSIAGPLSVSVPRDFGISFLDTALLRFASAYPDIQLHVDFDDRAVDLTRENYDFAIRIANTTDPSLVATRIGDMRHQLCASPDYLAKHGTPSTVQQLGEHALLYFGAARRAVWAFALPDGKSESISFQPALNSNSGQFLLEATLQGHGIVYLPDFLTSISLETGQLVPILAPYTTANWGIYLLSSDTRRLNRRMRLFANAMKTACVP